MNLDTKIAAVTVRIVSCAQIDTDRITAFSALRDVDGGRTGFQRQRFNTDGAGIP